MNFRKVRGKARRALNEYILALFVGLTRFVWIERSRNTGDGLDHAIFIDGEREHILNSGDDYPIRLSDEGLCLCGGEDVTYFYVSEVHEIFCTST